MEFSNLFRNILAAVDAEGLATPAVVRGAALASVPGATLGLLHVVDVPPALWPGIDQEQLAKMHAAALERARERVLASLRPGLRAAGIERDPGPWLEVIPGHPAKGILRKAAQQPSDLILLGAHSKRSVLDFGHTARAVLAGATCPVWTQGIPVAPVDKILVPIDFSHHSRKALHCALELADRLQASVRVLHCYAPPILSYASGMEAIPESSYVIDAERKLAKAQLKLWVEECEWDSVEVDSQLVEDAATPAILRAAEDCSLIVMGTHGRTGLSRFILGSVAYSVLKRSEKPVLVVPDASHEWQLDDSDDSATG